MYDNGIYEKNLRYACLGCSTNKDEGIAFAERLRAEGLSTELHEANGACHGDKTALGRILEVNLQKNPYSRYLPTRKGKGIEKPEKSSP